MQACGRADTRARLRHAELYLSLAQTVLGEDGAEGATVAAGNAVLAAIAASDAICCAAGGARYRGPDHRKAGEHLERITGDKQLASLLRDIVDLKDAGHYGLSDIATSRGTSGVRKAEQLVSAARTRVR